MNKKEAIYQYNLLHKKNKNYGIGQLQKLYQDQIYDFCKQNNVKSSLDFGCGKGQLADFLNKRGIKVYYYDPAIDKFSNFPYNKEVDLVYSFDVFEHLFEDSLHEEISLIKSVNPVYIYLHIATIKAKHYLPNGENCHTIIKDKNWWKSSLNKLLNTYNLMYEQDVIKDTRIIGVCLIYEKERIK